MVTPGQTPGPEEEAPIESRRTGLAKPEPSEPELPDEEEAPPANLSDFGELAPEAARPSPLDDIAEAERERLPRD